jgi:hypothetical protein
MVAERESAALPGGEAASLPALPGSRASRALLPSSASKHASTVDPVSDYGTRSRAAFAAPGQDSDLHTLRLTAASGQST